MSDTIRTVGQEQFYDDVQIMSPSYEWYTGGIDLGLS